MDAGTIIGGIVAFIKAIPIIDGWFQQIMVAWMDGQNADTKSKILDAAALGARAVTDADRYKASQMWQVALKRPRITS